MTKAIFLRMRVPIFKIGNYIKGYFQLIPCVLEPEKNKNPFHHFFREVTMRNVGRSLRNITICVFLIILSGCGTYKYNNQSYNFKRRPWLLRKPTWTRYLT